MATKTTLDDYLNLEMFVERYPQFKMGQLRWLVVKKEENGFAKCFKRIGRRLYINVPVFLKVVEKSGA
jgi:hypothetical protein